MSVFFPIDSILINENRQRQEFKTEALVDLGQSIRDKQLINAIALVSESNPILVAGERRLKVITALHKKGVTLYWNQKEIPAGHIPVSFVGELTTLQLEELELDENLKREDLTWQEETAALARLLEMRKQTATEQQLPAPTQKVLAAETKRKEHQVQSALKVSQHLDNPEVAKAKTLKDAVKVIDRLAKEEDIARRAAVVDTERLVLHKFFHGDCRNFMKESPDSKFSAVITDPPYGIDMHKDVSWDGSRHEYEDSEAYALELISDLLPEWNRTTKDQAHVYLFCDFAKFALIKGLFLCLRTNGTEVVFRPEFYKVAAQGEQGVLEDTARADAFLAFMASYPEPVFDPMYFPLVWNKGNVAAYPKPDHWPRKSYECILYAIKGSKHQNKLDLAVIDIPQIQNQDHPAGKPLALYRHLLNRSCIPGDYVLDNFAGQGNIFLAAREMKCYAYGSELSDKYANLSKLALEQCL